jgi:site-specific DNA-methyltransferase (adenine-specific)
MCKRTIGPFPCCSIIPGDSAALLRQIPDESIPLVITDPPYGMAFISGHRQLAHEPIFGDTTFPTELVRLAINKARMAAYVFCRWDNLMSGHLPPPRSTIAWVKNNWGLGDRQHAHGRQWEAICFYPRSQHSFAKPTSDVIYASRTGNDLHPTQKPVDLIKQLIRCNVGDTVLDPFVGSGTTCVAAKQLGRHFLGFEIDAKHYNTAVVRAGGLNDPRSIQFATEQLVNGGDEANVR